MVGPPQQCGVCREALSKYKCPACILPYCSLACFKTHKVDCGPKEQQQESQEQREEQPHELQQPPKGEDKAPEDQEHALQRQEKDLEDAPEDHQVPQVEEHAPQLEEAPQVLYVEGAQGNPLKQQDQATFEHEEMDYEKQQPDRVFEEGTWLRKAQFEALAGSKEMRGMLQANPHLQRVIRKIDASTNVDEELEAARQEEPGFQEFLDKMLQVLQTS